MAASRPPGQIEAGAGVQQRFTTYGRRGVAETRCPCRVPLCCSPLHFGGRSSDTEGFACFKGTYDAVDVWEKDLAAFIAASASRPTDEDLSHAVLEILPPICPWDGGVKRTSV